MSATAGQSQQMNGVDSVNLFNGNLSLSVPIGQSYPVNGALSYGLGLHYNSKVWDDELIGPNQNAADPSLDFNAGLGWQLGLGRTEFTESTPVRPVYVAPDGGRHVFYSDIHPGTTATGFLFTHDSSYLRRSLVGADEKIEFPDGTIRWFNAGKLTKIEDRFGNDVNVSQTASAWTLTDEHGRVQTVNFQNKTVGAASVPMVTSIVLRTFGGTTATLTFGYSQTSVTRGCYDTFHAPGATVSVPLLTSIGLPDGTSWVFTYFATGDPTSGRQGAISSAQLPTLGKTDYAYSIWEQSSGCQERESLRNTPGIASRTLRNASGGVEGVWSYSHVPTAYTGTGACSGSAPGLLVEEVVTTVTTPLGHQNKHYFSAWLGSALSDGGFRNEEYGLPFTRSSSVASGGNTLYLSSEILEGAATRQRRHVKYEWEAFLASSCNGGLACSDRNRRLAASRTTIDNGA